MMGSSFAELFPNQNGFLLENSFMSSDSLNSSVAELGSVGSYGVVPEDSFFPPTSTASGSGLEPFVGERI